jgi:hypothetical protein
MWEQQKKKPAVVHAEQVPTPTTSVKQHEQKTVQKKPDVSMCVRRVKIKKYRYILCAMLVTVLVVPTFLMSSRQHQTRLRKIQKVNCVVEVGDYVCRSTFHTGTMLIRTSAACKKNIYEIDGVPFVNIRHFESSTVEVPASAELRIRDAQPTCTVSVHRVSHPVSLEPTEGVVWITTDSHTQFTMKIKNVVILDQTPTGLLQFSVNGRWVAYSFNVDLYNVRRSDIVITGDADAPITVYL